MTAGSKGGENYGWRLREGTLDLGSPVGAGIVNVTTDSMWEGARSGTPDQAIADGLRLAESGFGMLDVGARPDRTFMKCARVTGDVMGKYHPHGDGAIYDALVRMAQPHSLRHPLVQGHGNFGSPDDGPAAARYTECRLDPLAMQMLATSRMSGVLR